MGTPLKDPVGPFRPCQGLARDLSISAPNCSEGEIEKEEERSFFLTVQYILLQLLSEAVVDRRAFIVYVYIRKIEQKGVFLCAAEWSGGEWGKFAN